MKETQATNTFLTNKQLKILELRGKGYTQEEIAKVMGHSRENVTITEKRAKENIEKARRTILAYEMLDPIRMEVKEGTDVFDIPALIFREADKHRIKVLYNTTSLIGIIRRKAGEKIAGNKVDRQFEVLILRSGRIII
jgi:hypothetical protein